MKTIIALIAFFIASAFSYAQGTSSQDQVFQIVEQMPVFPGGEKALNEYLAGVAYPAVAMENSITGSVYVRFIIEKDGAITNVEVAKGSDKLLNDAAMEHVRNMPSWTPGYQNGKPVRVQFIVPFNFKIAQQEEEKKNTKGKKKK